MQQTLNYLKCDAILSDTLLYFLSAFMSECYIITGNYSEDLIKKNIHTYFHSSDFIPIGHVNADPGTQDLRAALPSVCLLRPVVLAHYGCSEGSCVSVVTNIPSSLLTGRPDFLYVTTSVFLPCLAGVTYFLCGCTSCKALL